MQNRFKFRAALKTAIHSIIVPVSNVLDKGYIIDLNTCEKIFEQKYPSDCFWNFIDEIKKQDYIQEVSDDCDLIIAADFTNLMQTTCVLDATKFKTLTQEQKEEWLKNHNQDEWQGVEIFEEDVVAISYGKGKFEYGVVFYLGGFGGAGYTKGGTSLASYQKNTTIIGNIYEGYPKEAERAVQDYLKDWKVQRG